MKCELFFRNENMMILKAIHRFSFSDFNQQYARFKTRVYLPIFLCLSFITRLFFTECLFTGSRKSEDDGTDRTCVKHAINGSVLLIG